MKIWPADTSIEVLGVSGPYSSGKTLFLLTIDPKRTLYFDFEKSGGTYEKLGVTRVDVPGELHEKHPNGYTQLQTFLYWNKYIKSIEKDKYTVIATDPITDIEDGLVEWVKSRYKEFGFKSAESFVSMGGVFWNHVRSEWKVILNDLASRCQTFAFSSHLRKIWKHGKATDKQEPKGKATLMEIASLYLLLDRSPRKKEDPVPIVPSAVVLKSRLTSITEVDGELRIVPSLPQRLPHATPAAIREYICSPPDYDNLSEEEREQEKVLSEDEKLELEAKIAEDHRVAAEKELETMEKKKAIEDQKAAALKKLVPSANKSVEQGTNGSTNGLLPEGDVRTMLRTAHSKGLSDRVLKGIWNKLKSRGVDVSGFKTETAVEYARMMTKDEFSTFRKHVDVAT